MHHEAAKMIDSVRARNNDTTTTATTTNCSSFVCRLADVRQTTARYSWLWWSTATAGAGGKTWQIRGKESARNCHEFSPINGKKNCIHVQVRLHFDRSQTIRKQHITFSFFTTGLSYKVCHPRSASKTAILDLSLQVTLVPPREVHRSDSGHLHIHYFGIPFTVTASSQGQQREVYFSATACTPRIAACIIPILSSFNVLCPSGNVDFFLKSQIAINLLLLDIILHFVRALS